MYHSTKFKFRPRNLSVPPAPPQWLFALSDPPPKLDDDEWDLVEHVRIKGQINDGAPIHYESWFGPPVYSAWHSLIDNNAGERTVAEAQNQERRQELQRQIDEALKRAVLRKEQREQFKRDHYEKWFAQKREQDEARQLRRDREDEQRRRDEEWEAAEVDAFWERFQESDPPAQRRQMIRTIAGWFPHTTMEIIEIVEREFLDREWVEARSKERNNMSFDDLLWRRTRFLAGYR